MSKMSRYPAFSLLFGWSVLIFGCASPQLSDSQYSRNGKNNDCNMQTKDEVFFVDGGTVDRRYTYTYDTNGNVLTEEVDYDADGTVDKLNSWTYTYDSDGNMLSEERDYGADGTGAERHTYTYDANGNILIEEVSGGGLGNQRYTYTYDSDGNMLTEELEDEGNDWRYTYTYDTNGNMLSEERDYGADGTVDERYTYTYDANGNMLSEEVYGADGTVNERYTYTYDANGNMLSEEVDHDADGTVDKLKSWTYTYDSDGNMLSAEFYGADGTLSSSYTYTWSCE